MHTVKSDFVWLSYKLFLFVQLNVGSLFTKRNKIANIRFEKFPSDKTNFIFRNLKQECFGKVFPKFSNVGPIFRDRVLQAA